MMHVIVARCIVGERPFIGRVPQAEGIRENHRISSVKENNQWSTTHARSREQYQHWYPRFLTPSIIAFDISQAHRLPPQNSC
jgi:hypothetical protein